MNNEIELINLAKNGDEKGSAGMAEQPHQQTEVKIWS